MTYISRDPSGPKSIKCSVFNQSVGYAQRVCMFAKSKCDKRSYFLKQNKIDQSQRTEENVLLTHSPGLLRRKGGGQQRHRG